MIKIEKEYVEIISEKVGRNLRETLSSYGLSRRLFNRYFKEKNIYVNGENVRKGYMVKSGDVIKIDYKEDNDYIEAEKIKLDILYEDNGLLIINKKSGMVVHPIKYYTSGTLLNGVKYYFLENNIKTSPRLVNRLDKDTEGLVIIAKNAYIDSIMSRLIKENLLERKYIALVKGVVKQDTGLINKPILKIDGEMERQINERGKDSLTEYKVIKRLNGHSILELKLLTGRSHQIRLHLKSIGHEIVSDPIYGEKIGEEMFLCSYYLKFIHPITKEKIEIKLDHKLKEYLTHLDNL